jgi:hypothetical protein
MLILGGNGCGAHTVTGPCYCGRPTGRNSNKSHSNWPKRSENHRACVCWPILTSVLGAGFGADDGASLVMAFRGLQAESAAQGAVHQAVAKELHTLVIDPFEHWARGYKVYRSLQYESVAMF